MPTEPLSAANSPLDANQNAQVNKLAGELTPSELTWVAGYLTGLSSTAGAAVATPAAASQVLTILYGSQTGNAKAVAESLLTQAKSEGIAAELHSMANFKPKQLKAATHLAVLVSTHGEGDAPDDAETLHELLGSKKAPKLDGLQYAVLAFGDTSYELFCQTGKDFDQRLANAGAKSLLDRVDLDVDYEEQADAWKSTVCKTVAPLLSVATSPTAPVLGTVAPAGATQYTRKNPFNATLSGCQKITGRDSIKDIRHIEIDLDGSGIQYKPGDSLGVYFKNDPKLVASVLTALEIDPATSIGDETIEQALTESYELTKLHAAFVAKYAEVTKNAELTKISADKETLKAYVADRQIADVVKQNPSKLDAATFTECLRKLSPRLYSIASSQAEVEEEVHLTIATVEYEAHGETHLGGASGYLCRRVEEGDTIKVFAKSNDNFRLPADPVTPVIMIGPGTGVAPFRAFIQERAAAENKGDSWLFFGAPHFTQDFLYQTEWQDYLNDGLLTRIDLAFSRDQDHKIYVQDRIRENAAELWAWIERGAHIYVCGDASRMAKDVQSALLEIIQKHGKLAEDKANEFLTQLRRDKRYQRDVY